MSDSLSSASNHLAPASAPDDGKPDARGYRTVPSQTDTGMPRGVPYIIGNEAAERFSFYGMKSILTTFMVGYLVTRAGVADHMNKNEAAEWTHYFVAGVYYLPVIGALLSDGLLGKYRTILWLSIVYCFGHFALALDDTRLGLMIGLSLICVGAGGIKPCVSANVGDQFGHGNRHLLTKVFGWFYFSINAGSSISSLLCPALLEDKRFGPHWAFGIPGVAMLIATIFFWLGRRKFVHVPPSGLGFLRTASGPEGRGVLLRLLSVYVFLVIWWALWDQSSGVEWTLQARDMNLRVPWLPWVSMDWNTFHVTAGWGLKLAAGQVQTANAILILIYIPLVNIVIYPAINRVFPLTPLRKIGIGLFLMIAAYAVIVYIQHQVDPTLDIGGVRPDAPWGPVSEYLNAGFDALRRPYQPSINWQLLAYVILTLSEAMVSITGLEFSYTQAPNSMKSVVMALWLFAIATGNILVAQFHSWNSLPNKQTKITDAQFFTACMWTMVVTAVAFVIMARFYRGKTYLQGAEVKAEADIGAATNMPA